MTGPEAVAIALNRISDTGRGLRLDHPRHQASFDQEGLTFGAKSGGPSWRWQLADSGPDTVSPVRGADRPNAVEYHRGIFTEQYLPRAQSIEQRLIVAERPRGGDPLVIRGRVECDGEFVVAWESIPTANSGREEIRAQRLLPTSGDEVGKNDFLLSDMGPEGGDAFGAHTPAVSINTTDGSLLAVWSGDDDENGRIDELIDPDGGVGTGRRYFQRMRS